MKLTGTFYDLIVRLGYNDDLVIEKVELVDLMTIIPVLDRMKHYDGYVEKEVEIVIKQSKIEEAEDGKISECL